MFDGILFDLDGTLWDSTYVIEQVWARVLPRHPEVKRPPVLLQEIRESMGLTLPDIALRLFPDLTTEAGFAILLEANAENGRSLAQNGGALYPGAIEALECLSARCPLYIVSNCGNGYIDAFFSGNGLGHYFSGCEWAGRTGLPKSGNIALVARQYGLNAPVYIGDTQLDYTSAREAGVPFLHAAYGFGSVDAPVPAARTFGEIPALLDKMSPP